MRLRLGIDPSVSQPRGWGSTRRGGLPRAFLARSEADTGAWREHFLRTFLERDRLTRRTCSGIPSSALPGRASWSRRCCASSSPPEAYFWATHQGAELDLLCLHRGRRYGFEFKRADAPAVTPSMRIALTDLRLAGLTVFYPGSQRYRLTDRIVVRPALDLVALSWSGLDRDHPRRRAR